VKPSVSKKTQKDATLSSKTDSVIPNPVLNIPNPPMVKTEAKEQNKGMDIKSDHILGKLVFHNSQAV
jgi:hypothetical protein